MPFDQNADLLKAFVASAIDGDPQILTSLEEADYDRTDLESDIVLQSNRIYEIVTEDIKKYNSLESDFDELNEKFQNDSQKSPTEPKYDASNISIAAMLCAILYGMWLLGYGIYNLVVNWSNLTGSISSGWMRIIFNLLPEFLLIMVMMWFDRREDKRYAAARREYVAEHDRWKIHQSAVKSSTGIESAQIVLDNQRSIIEELLLSRVKQEIVSSINGRMMPSFSPNLQIRRPRGFGEIFDKRFTIYTPARQRLEFMLKNMPGGSIGIAGSRGAGKTTLLKNFCGPKRIIADLNDKPVLGILVSAPVAYQARDFLLYLFTTACQNVIEAEGGRYAPPELATDPPASHLPKRADLAAFRPVASLLAKCGSWMVLIAFILSFALALLTYISSGGAPAPTTQSSPAVTAPSGSGPSSQPVQAGSVPQAATPSSPEPQTAEDRTSILSRFLGFIKIDPGAILAWGMAFIILGCMFGELAGLGARRAFLLGFYGAFGIFRAGHEQLIATMAAEEASAAEEIAARTPQESDQSLVGQARLWLKSTKFQQSYTSGWSGSLKLPIGMEGGVNRVITLAQNQLSMPEIGYFLAQFLERASQKYQVIVGIDELDKLASDDIARQFVNDIKSIFGLERCFYLVSVSENAMSSFERRGLPFRDEFDSAFDDLIYVDHLNFAFAAKLLEQRVVGRPIPFFALSYCMSGGLARDLIRNFRNVIEAYEQDRAGASLSAICSKIVTVDIASKLRAVATSARKIKLEPHVDQFLELVHELESAIGSDDKLTNMAGLILKRDPEDSPVPASGDASEPVRPAARRPRKPRSTAFAGLSEMIRAGEGSGPERQELLDLMEEIGTYIQFCVTLRQFFTDRLDENRLRMAIDSGDLDRLAKGRQLLGVNPLITLSTIRSFRSTYQLSPPL